MNADGPDEQTLRAALAIARRAPSVHNTQPWRFRIGDHGVRVYLDPARARQSGGTVERDAIVSCGAALHHLRIALAAAGWSAVVRRLPDTADSNQLAAISLVPHRPTMLERSLGSAIVRRQTDRRNFSSSPIPPGYVGLVNERARTLGASIRQAVDTTREQLVEALYAAAMEPGHRGHRPDFAKWSGRSIAPDGSLDRHLSQCPDTWIGRGVNRAPGEPDFAELLVLGTQADDRLAWLCAGEALSAVLLTATNVGLSTCTLTEPLEIPELRERIRAGVLENRAYPQAVIRIGWAPADAAELPPSTRRTVADVLDSCETAAC